MKKRYYVLFASILVAALLVLCLGAFLKGRVYDPYGIYEKESVFSLPFVLLADGKLDDAFRGDSAPTVPANTTEAADTQPQTTVPETSVPETSVPVTSEPETSSRPPESSAPATTTPPATTVPETTRPPKVTEKDPEPSETEKPTTPPVTITPGQNTGSYFDDALFIGDSRMVGMREYARLGNADYFCTVGMNCTNALYEEASDKNFSSTTLSGLLASKKYGKIYITLGINDCGYPKESFMSNYRNLLNTVMDAQPDAIIILHSIMVVSASYVENGSYFDSPNIQDLNEAIAGLNDGSKIFYIDVNEVMADEEGYLRSELTGDGCHLYASDNQIWADWLTTKIF